MPDPNHPKTTTNSPTTNQPDYEPFKYSARPVRAVVQDAEAAPFKAPVDYAQWQERLQHSFYETRAAQARRAASVYRSCSNLALSPSVRNNMDQLKPVK